MKPPSRNFMNLKSRDAEVWFSGPSLELQACQAHIEALGAFGGVPGHFWLVEPETKDTANKPQPEMVKHSPLQGSV